MEFSRRRAIAYAAAITGLAVLNILYWSWGEQPVLGATRVSSIQLPSLDLYLAKSLSEADASPDRDIFQFASAPKEPALRPVVVETSEPGIDPNERIREEVMEQFRSIQFKGVLKVDNRYVALLEHEGETMLLAEGREVMPGFEIGSISNVELKIQNKQVSFDATYSLDGGEPVFSPGDVK